MGYNPNRRKNKVKSFRDDLILLSSNAIKDMMGADEQTAQAVSARITRDVCAMYGKTSMYVPSNADIERAERAERIWEDYGQNTTCARKYTQARIEELAQEHNLSTVQIYNIVRHKHHEETLRRQPTLPGLEVE